MLQGTRSQSNILLLCKMQREHRKGCWMEKSKTVEGPGVFAWRLLPADISFWFHLAD